MESKNNQSIIQSNIQEKTDKTSEIPPVILIRMEEVAPEGETIDDSDGKHEDYRAVYYILITFSKRVKMFYQKQDALIDDYERTDKRANNDEEEQEKNDNLNKKTKKMTDILSRASLAVNIVSNLINSTI
jgi:hypothetical protein